MARPKSIDTPLLIIVAVLVFGGFMIFSSASLSLLARSGASIGSVVFSQVVFGIVGGIIAMVFMSNIHYRHWRKYAFYIYLGALILTLGVFIPGIGMSHAGATRWLDLGVTTVQPAEFLKIAFVIYLATWLSGMKGKVEKWQYGLLPFAIITGITGIVLLLQPDTDTFAIIAASGLAMFLVSGAKWRDIAIIVITGVAMLALLASVRPYVMDRLTTFLHPENDPLGSGYQIQQSLIAVGSGGIVGRGYGQSIQKFEYLPEAIGDSIFAVYAEEFGFIGTLILIGTLVAFGLRGYRIAVDARDIFGTLLVTGIISLILAQSFLNIGAMIALAPVSGLPLPFISHGGTALLATLAAIGIVLNVSKYRVKRKRA